MLKEMISTKKFKYLGFYQFLTFIHKKMGNSLIFKIIASVSVTFFPSLRQFVYTAPKKLVLFGRKPIKLLLESAWPFEQVKHQFTSGFSVLLLPFNSSCSTNLPTIKIMPMSFKRLEMLFLGHSLLFCYNLFRLIIIYIQQCFRFRRPQTISIYTSDLFNYALLRAYLLQVSISIGEA